MKRDSGSRAVFCRAVISALALGKRLIVRGRSVDRRDRLIGQSQVDRQLSAVMREMVEGVAKHDMPRLFHHHLAAGTQPPLRRHQEFVVGLRERFARLRKMSIERDHQLIGRRLLVLTTSWRRCEIELVLIDDQRDPGRH